MSYENVDDTNIPNEAAHAEAIDAHMARTSTQAAVANVAVLSAATEITPVASAGATYDEAEADAAVAAINLLITQGAATEANVISLDAKVNAILGVLRDAELIPAS